jgi:hypothetical protein
MAFICQNTFFLYLIGSAFQSKRHYTSLEIYYTAMIIETVWYWNKNRYITIETE